jgi:hypothetical protein
MDRKQGRWLRQASASAGAGTAEKDQAMTPKLDLGPALGIIRLTDYVPRIMCRELLRLSHPILGGNPMVCWPNLRRARRDKVSVGLCHRPVSAAG